MARESNFFIEGKNSIQENVKSTRKQMIEYDVG